MKRGVGALVGAAWIAVAVLAVPSTARAGTPNPINVSPGSNGAYSGTVGPGWPDPNGPPAPAGCSSNAGGLAPCDIETVNLSRGAAPASDTLSLQVVVTFTPSDPMSQNCLDVAIEDSSRSQVFAHTSCSGSPATVSDPNAAPGAYTIEVDADGTSAVGVGMQSFNATVSSTATAGTGGPTPTPVPTNPITFTHEVSVDVQHGDGEPDLAISSDNKDLYTATPYGFSTTVSLMWKSSDSGVQWDNLHGAAAGDTPPCPDPVAIVLRPDCSRGGGDAEVQLSQPSTPGGPQTVQFEDLNGLDSISCAYSTNGGDTFNDLVGYTISGNPVPGSACDEGGTVPPACQTIPPPTGTCGALGTDRQWVQVWPQGDQPSGTSDGQPTAAHDFLYMTFDTGDQPPSGDAAIFSYDNGQHWEAACTTLTSSSCLGGSNGVGSRPGPLVINPTLINHVTTNTATHVTGGVFPTLYEFMGTNSNGTEVNISCDGGQTWSHVATSNGMAGSTTNDFVAGAIDANGEVYTAFTVANDPNPWRVWFVHSTDTSGTPGVGDCSVPVQGGKWSTPVALTGPPSTADGVAATPIPSQSDAVMPWLTAGSGGRIDLVYYGTAAPLPRAPDTQAEDWYLHMAQSLDGGTTWTDEQATEQPMHTKSICFSGIGCTAQTPPGGDRNLLDFFQVKTDSTGRAVIIFTDDNNSAACAPTCSAGIGLISELQQATGPSLLSGSVPPLPVAGLGQSLDMRYAGADATVTDPSDDALLAPPGHNLGTAANEVPAADITNLQVCLTNNTACPVANTSPNTLAFLITVKSLAGGPASAVVASDGSIGANWLITWRSNNDLWFAQASTDPSGNLSCVYGRPMSVYNDGEPKAVEYLGPTSNSKAGLATGCHFSTTNNTIEIDVPFNATSGLSSTSILYGLTGWTGNATTALPAGVCSVGGGSTDCSGDLGFFNNIDETAPIDVSISGPSSGIPEVPAVALIVVFGAAVVGGGSYLRRRRARRIV